MKDVAQDRHRDPADHPRVDDHQGRLLALVFIVAAAGLLIWGGMKLLGNDTKRIR